jgi:alkanesulfonate monooxygenase SsuD/methylene tetrahydromethanopterin reductase-like flavin-dependent oxidoreductase (luciferase family)
MTRSLGPHPYALGLFAPNVSGGLTQTLAPERWEPTWEHNRALAQMAEDAGLDFILPLATWLGLRGDAPTDGVSLETLTWAAGILAATSRITVFATVHTAFLNPVVAAKMIATCDHIGAGRFGLNIVSGSKPDEYAIMGVELLEHDERYLLTQEWLEIVRRIWREHLAFDHRGRFFTLEGVQSEPKPYGGTEPLVISAGSSPAGRAFAARNADCLFMVIPSLEGLAESVAAIRAQAGRPIGVYSSGHVICRPTRRETEEYYHHIVHDHGDWAAGDHLIRAVWPNSESLPVDRLEMYRERCVSGHATWPLIGTPDEVAAGLRALHEAGLDGTAFSLVNYLEDFPIVRDEVLPRLQRLGLRVAI